LLQGLKLCLIIFRLAERGQQQNANAECADAAGEQPL
jgi:hypothetical protein